MPTLTLWREKHFCPVTGRTSVYRLRGANRGILLNEMVEEGAIFL
jgi:hypothetical protein